MRDRRVIYDSEDDEERFSPVNSPVPGVGVDVLVEREDGEERRVEEPEQTSDSRSTDPEFFKQIYEQHNAVAHPISDSLEDKASSERQKNSERKAKTNSSSITDPALKSAKKSAMGKTDAMDFADSTQVTTPSAPSAKQQDVYDFTLSDEEGGLAETSVSRVKRQNTATLVGKRKRGQEEAADSKPPQLSTASRDAVQGEEDEVPRSTRKKRKSAGQQTQRSIPDDVDLLVIPTTAEVDESGETHAHDRMGSLVPDTFRMGASSKEPPPASFFIAPPTRLTASQKQEYLPIGDSSELDREADFQQASLPAPKLPQTQGQLPANTASTIPYTTPSRYCSSVVPLPILENIDENPSSNSAASSVRRTQLDRTQPQSSPDELNSHYPEHTTRNVKRMRREPEHDELAQDNVSNSDDYGYNRETYESRPRRRRLGATGLENISENAQAGTSPATARKKRQNKHEHLATAQEDSWDSDKIGFHREQYVPRPSRRRSKAVVEEEDIEAPERSMPDTCPPGEAAFEDADNAAHPVLISSDDEAPRETIGGVEALDPEFLAAMPEDIRQEILSNHITQQSTRTLQAPRTRGRGRPSEVSSGPQPILEETAQPKKRGRKKKEPKDEGLSAMVEEAGAEPSPAPIAIAKRKRGRPKKSDTTQPSLAPVADEQAPAPQPIKEPHTMETGTAETGQGVAAAPKAPSKRGRKKKVVVNEPDSPVLPEPDETVLEAEEALCPRREDAGAASGHLVDGASDHADLREGREALRDISNSASQGTSTTGQAAGRSVAGHVEMQTEVTPERGEKEDPRSASTTSAQGKVPFRVGLSKRSRIAPLLKIIRK